MWDRGQDLVDRQQLRDALQLFQEAISLIKSSLGTAFYHATRAESQTRKDLRDLGQDLCLSYAEACCMAGRFNEAHSIVLEAATMDRLDHRWDSVRGETLMGLERIQEASRCFAVARDEKRTRKAVMKMMRSELASELIREAQKRIDPHLFTFESSEVLGRAVQDCVTARTKEGRNVADLLVSLMLSCPGSDLLPSTEVKLLISSALIGAGQPRVAARLAATSALDLLPIVSSGEADVILEQYLDLLAESHYYAGLAASKASTATCPDSPELLLAAARSLARATEINPLPSLYRSTLLAVTKSLAAAQGGLKAAEIVKSARTDPLHVEALFFSLGIDETLTLDHEGMRGYYRLVTRSGRPLESKAHISNHPFGLSRVYYDSKQLPENWAWIELSDGSCRWRQTAASLSILVLNLPETIKAQDLVVDIRARHLSVQTRSSDNGMMIFGGALPHAVNPSSSTWSIDEGQLVIDLVKSNFELLRGGGAAATWWDRLFAAHPPITSADDEKDYSDLPPEILKAIRPPRPNEQRTDINSEEQE